MQSVLRARACGWTCQNSQQRTDALASWQHHYNSCRPHPGIDGFAPMFRLHASRSSLLTLHS